MKPSRAFISYRDETPTHCVACHRKLVGGKFCPHHDPRGALRQHIDDVKHTAKHEGKGESPEVYQFTATARKYRRLLRLWWALPVGPEFYSGASQWR